MIIYAKKLKNGDINTTVIDEETNCTVFCETGHPAAWEALVYFAKQIISENDRIEFEEHKKPKDELTKCIDWSKLAEQLQGQPYD